MSPSLIEALATLGINDIGDQPPKLKSVQKQFYLLSMLHHPDRPGGDNPKYQKITEAYRIVGDYIESNFESEGDSEEEIARHAFNCFNFDDIKENLFSFTIKIDNNLSPVWDSVLTKHYGEPVDRKGNGKHWKHRNHSVDDSNNGDNTIGK